MPKYDDSLFSPPAPVASVILRDPSSAALLNDIPMLLDYGADVSVIPQSALDSLGASSSFDEGVELMGFDGQTTISQIARLDLIFQNKTFKGRFPVIEGQDWGIIGGDVLNHVTILLDGPRLVWETR